MVSSDKRLAERKCTLKDSFIWEFFFSKKRLASTEWNEVLW